jgi:predicted PurR-regulated permease PerM
MPDGATKIAIPRWIQLVGLPLLLLLGWALANAVGRAVFLFLVAGLIALLLNPMVRALGRLRIPRGVAVAAVYLSFAAAATFTIVALATVGVDRVRSTANRIDNYFTEEGKSHQTAAEHDVDRLQAWLDSHHLQRLKIRKQGLEFVRSLNVKKVTSKAITLIEGAAVSAIEILLSIVLVIVVSIYMLLDMSKLSAAIDRRFPPKRGSPPLMTQLESALAGYVKGQLLLSLIIGTSAGAALWLIGAVGLVPGVDRYAFFFGLWVAFTELIPFLGPWLGAIPPLLYGLAVHPFSAIWVAVLFLAIHQIEGHIVVPKVMGSALRLHPLLVIFGLLAGAEIYGILGVFVVLPMLAVFRALWEFFGERIALEPWTPVVATAGGTEIEAVGAGDVDGTIGEAGDTTPQPEAEAEVEAEVEEAPEKPTQTGPEEVTEQ